ncbi:hypothetical protein [Streptomyces sp. NPDC090131]|uniref:hypothetical protein n=1 Tax=Streptomyces sp. NPDC090131 TaxID=3365954 RepID=UPI003825DBB4
MAGAAVPGGGGRHGRGDVDTEYVAEGADLRPQRGHGPSGAAAEVHGRPPGRSRSRATAPVRETAGAPERRGPRV